jgi:hypothetical protein
MRFWGGGGGDDRCLDDDDEGDLREDTEEEADEMVDIASLGARFLGFINRSMPERTSLATEDDIVAG